MRPPPISTSKAIWIGLLVVNGPVLVLLCGPLFVLDYCLDHRLVSRDLSWLGFILFPAGFALAWTWWSFTVERWRMWALRRGADPEQLEQAAIDVGLLWPK